LRRFFFATCQGVLLVAQRAGACRASFFFWTSSDRGPLSAACLFLCFRVPPPWRMTLLQESADLFFSTHRRRPFFSLLPFPNRLDRTVRPTFSPHGMDPALFTLSFGTCCRILSPVFYGQIGSEACQENSFPSPGFPSQKDTGRPIACRPPKSPKALLCSLVSVPSPIEGALAEPFPLLRLGVSVDFFFLPVPSKFLPFSDVNKRRTVSPFRRICCSFPRAFLCLGTAWRASIQFVLRCLCTMEADFTLPPSFLN